MDEQSNGKEYYDYYPFGKTLRSSITDQAVATYKFTGKELDDENDLHWYDFGARYYDPGMGRFLQVDRIEVCLYFMVGESPRNWLAWC